ncbi:alpha/beta-hydrolase family protein [Rhodococcus rhodochrous]|uniref:alpha/beta-hydrolase family protein n=1 Tax=Rhodococcus rhodochrous TaxID=1829 RepID=UPI001E3EDB35|nr:alpha/beta-hydrolase family protein [Rhodococcus rhodochrous]MCD2096299.1 alpha/beta hydrolase [Rhodococcus rhodochrous]MCD2121057.1 alpha/beta hydrolase [Rhodococcus rhodochrous]MCQ4134674.1 alpha/beta hydrolase [Rhodococcus rhodochrous]MDJ0017922.1 alpha/beta-hydrolase family protein [Rhodococcus rhodochrous]
MTILTVVLATVISLAPPLLPRQSVVQGVVTGVFVVVALAVLRLVVTARRRTGRAPRPARPELRVPVALVGGAVVLVAAAGAHRWQNGLREAMAVPALDVRWWLEALAVAIVVVAALLALPRLVHLLSRRGVAVAVAATLGIGATVGIGATAAFSRGGAIDTVASPTALSVGLSGGVGSAVSWNRLGREGQKFVSLPSEGSPIRIYVPLSAAPDPSARAEFAVDELRRARAFDRPHLVVAVPTGSGWVDAAAVRGFEGRWGDDVAIVAQQYSDMPSWATFVLDRGAAEEEARALVTALRAHLSTLPDERRPALHVYGQSLGATGASAVFDDEPEPCALFLAGPPAGVRTAGASVRANTSDPVVWWRPSLLWSPPDLSHARADAPTPPWLPVVSFVNTTVDLLTSLEAAPGHGHRYGDDQARCTSSDG